MKGALREDQYTFLNHISLISFRMRNVSHVGCTGNQNTHFLSVNFFFSKILPFMRNVEKYCRAGQATADNMAHAHFMLDT